MVSNPEPQFWNIWQVKVGKRMHYPRIRKADKTNSTINLGENVTIMGKYIYIYIRNRVALQARQSKEISRDRRGDFIIFTSEAYHWGSPPLLTHQSDRELRDHRSVWMSVGVSSRWQHVIANPYLSNSSLVTSDRKTHNNLFCRNPK